MQRRGFLAGTLAALGASRAASAAEGNFEITRTEAEWRAMLSDAEFRVMRDHGTERAFTSPLHDLTKAGIYQCRGCDLPLYSSEHKFDSGTGWPSFWKAVDDAAIGTTTDRSFFMTRTECHCARCGSHMGHIFEDGPPPTGLRHCINGVSLTFREA